MPWTEQADYTCVSSTNTGPHEQIPSSSKGLRLEYLYLHASEASKYEKHRYPTYNLKTEIRPVWNLSNNIPNCKNNFKNTCASPKGKNKQTNMR